MGAGGTIYTTRNQGGGDKKQGLVSTTNTPSWLDARIRTGAGGGNRNWVFCANQLGGVGRRWGQAAGPGNRGGISGACKASARESRLRNRPKPCGAQVSGWGAARHHHHLSCVGPARACTTQAAWDAAKKASGAVCTDPTCCSTATRTGQEAKFFQLTFNTYAEGLNCGSPFSWAQYGCSCTDGYSADMRRVMLACRPN
jgi:hypothetical protein